MTQLSSVSAENGPDLGWKNLFWLFHLLGDTFFKSLLFLLPSKAADQRRLVITVSDMMFPALRDLVTAGCSVSLVFGLTGLEPVTSLWYSNTDTGRWGSLNVH